MSEVLRQGSDLFPQSNAKLQRDIDDLQIVVEQLPQTTIGTISSYDRSSETGTARTPSGSNVQFVNWTGVVLFENTGVLLVSKDGTNYAVATQETVSGWASTQVVSVRPEAELTISLRSSDVGKLILTTANGVNDKVGIPVLSTLGLSAGQSIDFVRGGEAAVEFGRGDNVILRYTPGPFLNNKNSAATLLCLRQNEYIIIGDLKA